MIDGLLFYRVGNWCYRHKVPLVPKMMKAASRVVYSSYLPSECTIGRDSMLGYGGLGTVVHPRAVIGSNVMVGPHVTIGGRSHQDAVPVIEDDVFIGTGACILGGITVGRGAVVGANAVVISDVPPRCVVAGVPARIIATDVESSEYGDLPAQLRARMRRRKKVHD